MCESTSLSNLRTFSLVCDLFRLSPNDIIISLDFRLTDPSASKRPQ